MYSFKQVYLSLQRTRGSRKRATCLFINIQSSRISAREEVGRSTLIALELDLFVAIRVTARKEKRNSISVLTFVLSYIQGGWARKFAVPNRSRCVSARQTSYLSSVHTYRSIRDECIRARLNKRQRLFVNRQRWRWIITWKDNPRFHLAYQKDIRPFVTGQGAIATPHREKWSLFLLSEEISVQENSFVI